MSLLDRLRQLRPRGSAALSAPMPVGTKDGIDAEYTELLRRLEEVRRSIVDVTMSRRQLEAQAAAVRETLAGLQGRAAASAAADRDGDARAALHESIAIERRLADRQKAIDDIRAQERHLEASSAKLQARIADNRVRMEVASARRAAANATQAAASAAGAASAAEAGSPENPPE